MGIELQLLVGAALLTFVQMLIALGGAAPIVGLVALSSNREDLEMPGGWVGRAARAHRNMLESLPLFAILVLVAVAAGKTNEMTALGAQIFFWGRIAYGAVYIIGIPWVRTGVWLVSTAGMLLMLLQLL